MNTDTPIAYFITWTIYGVHLQGDVSGWRKRLEGAKNPQPLLEEWHAERLKHAVKELTFGERNAVEQACTEHSIHRDWKIWAVNARSNHVHTVISAKSHKGTIVRDQLKANCTRIVRQTSNAFVDRPVWAVGGDVQFVWTEADLQQVIDYTVIAQDRKHMDSICQPKDASRGSESDTKPGLAPIGSQGDRNA